MDFNSVYIEGVVTSDVVLNHEIGGEKFYKFEVTVVRDSGFDDVLPIIASEFVLHDIPGVGINVAIKGEYRSRNDAKAEKKTILYIFANDIMAINDCSNYNEIELTGHLCKKPSYRETPTGKKITDLCLAVNRKSAGRTDYIPLICWARTALLSSKLEIGTQITVKGRIQSRVYTKTFEDGTQVTRTAYEVSTYYFRIEEE